MDRSSVVIRIRDLFVAIILLLAIDVYAKEPLGNKTALSLPQGRTVEVFPADIAADVHSGYETLHLSWSPAQMPNGVGYYEVLVDDQLRGTTVQSDYTVNRLQGGAAYQVTVVAVSRDGSQRLNAPPRVFYTRQDRQPPDAPQALTSLAITHSQVLLQWQAATDNHRVESYNIYRDGILIGTSESPAYLDEGLMTGAAYHYQVQAVDVAGNLSLEGGEYVAELRPGAHRAEVITKPRIVTDKIVSTRGVIRIAWEAGSHIPHAARYGVVVDGVIRKVRPARAGKYTIHSKDSVARHRVSIAVFDKKKQVLLTSDPVWVQNPMDEAAPQTPRGLSGVLLSSRRVQLHWRRAKDNHGVSEYIIFRDDVEVGRSDTPFFTNAGLLPERRYVFVVVARDAAGNQSQISKPYVVVTPKDRLMVQAYPAQVNLAWEPEYRAGSPATYMVYRDGREIARSEALYFRDNGVAAGQDYSYAVKLQTETGEQHIAGSPTQVATPIRQYPLTVSEFAGEDVASTLVSAFVPLPSGVYQQESSALADSFSVRDEAGQAVPAQFWVRSRYGARDNSIRELVAVFPASVAANSQARYYLEEGPASLPANPVVVAEEKEKQRLVVSNGRVSFAINTKAYNFLDYIDYRGVRLIDNRELDGPYLINEEGNEHRDASSCAQTLTPTIVAIEEEGPVRVRIRVERPAYVVQSKQDPCYAMFGRDSGEVRDPVPGFVTWFELAADADEIVVNHSILNNPITPYRQGREGDALTGWPLFYQEAGIRLALNMQKPGYGVILDGQLMDIDEGTRVLQEDEYRVTMNGRVLGEQTHSLLATETAGEAQGYGLALIEAFFDKTYPNGFAVERDNDGRVRLNLMSAPDGCSGCESMIGPEDKDRPNSGLYAIQDMSLADKSFVIRLWSPHDPIPQKGALGVKARAAILRSPPEVLLTPSAYAASDSSTDLFGLHGPFMRLKGKRDSDYSTLTASADRFGLKLTRYRTCNAGGIPSTGYRHYLYRPADLTLARWQIYDALKRPQIVPHFWGGIAEPTRYWARLPSPDPAHGSDDGWAMVEQGHYATEFSTSPYCKRVGIRSHLKGRLPYTQGKAFPAGYGTYKRLPGPYDNPHLWQQPLSDLPIDNPLLRYFKRGYEQLLIGYVEQLWASETFKRYHRARTVLAKKPTLSVAERDVLVTLKQDSERYQSMRDAYQSISDQYPSPAVRAIGNALISTVDYYLESNSPQTLIAIERYMDYILYRQRDDGSLAGTFSFQDTYLMHGVLNAMAVVPASHAIYKKGFSYLFGGGERPGLPGMMDAILTTSFGYYAEIGCGREGDWSQCRLPSPISFTVIDPMSIAAYLLAAQPDPYTGVFHRERAHLYMAHLIHLLNGFDVIGDAALDGPRPAGEKAWQQKPWDGSLRYRMLKTLGHWEKTDPLTWGQALQHIEGYHVP